MGAGEDEAPPGLRRRRVGPSSERRADVLGALRRAPAGTGPPTRPWSTVGSKRPGRPDRGSSPGGFSSPPRPVFRPPQPCRARTPTPSPFVRPRGGGGLASTESVRPAWGDDGRHRRSAPYGRRQPGSCPAPPLRPRHLSGVTVARTGPLTGPWSLARPQGLVPSDRPGAHPRSLGPLRPVLDRRHDHAAGTR